MEYEIPGKDVNNLNKSIGIETTIHRFLNGQGYCVYIQCFMYHLPKYNIHLFCPCTYHNMHGWKIIFYANRSKMHLSGNEVVVSIDRKLSNMTIFLLGRDFWWKYIYCIPLYISTGLLCNSIIILLWEYHINGSNSY